MNGPFDAAVKFERLLSYRPSLRSPTLRDVILGYYEKAYDGNEEMAKSAADQFTSSLYAKFLSEMK